MARPRKPTAQETKADALNKLLAEIDPAMMAGAVAAGIAGGCGVQGPLTRILIGLGKSPAEQLKNPAVTGFSIATLGIIPTLIAGLFAGQGTSSTTTAPSDDDKAALGAAMSNVVEFLILYKLATNDVLIGQLIGAGKDITAATIRAGGEAVPF